MARCDELNRIADDFVQARHSALASLRAEAERVREQLVRIETQISGAGTIAEYRRRYQPEVNGTPTCPYCFLSNGQTVPLTSQSSGAAWEEWLCRECQASVTLGPA
jgi:superfamily II helicase